MIRPLRRTTDLEVAGVNSVVRATPCRWRHHRGTPIARTRADDFQSITVRCRVARIRAKLTRRWSVTNSLPLPVDLPFEHRYAARPVCGRQNVPRRPARGRPAALPALRPAPHVRDSPARPRCADHLRRRAARPREADDHAHLLRALASIGRQAPHRSSRGHLQRRESRGW